MARRRSFSAKDRARIFAANTGTCHICKGKIDVGQAWEVEHVIPWALTQDDSDGNLRPAHKRCHRDDKTKQDVANIAEAKRREAKHLGYTPDAPKMTGRPFPKSQQAAARQAKASGKLPVPQRAVPMFSERAR